MKELQHPEAFEIFFRENHLPLVIYASRIVKDIEVARDIVQEVFLKTWENRDRSNIVSPKTYLFIAVKYQCFNYIKNKNVAQKFSDEVLADLNEMEHKYYEDADVTILELYEKETHARINRVVEQLPEKCRQIFEMSRFEGLKSAEIAERLKISLRTVETQLYRALRQLKENLFRR